MYLDAEKEAKKEYILSVCFETFMELGLERTSMRDLCDANGFGSATMYYYFSSKDEIVCQCVKNERQKIEETFDRLFEQAMEKNNFTELFDELMTLIDEHKRKLRFMYQVICSPYYEKIVDPPISSSSNYRMYIKRFAERIQKSEEEITPICYLIYSTMTNYVLYRNKESTKCSFDYLKQLIAC